MADFTEVGVIATVKNLNGFIGDLGKMDTGISNLTNVITTGLGVAVGNVLTGAFSLVTDAIGNATAAVFDFTKESVNMAAGFQDQVTILDIAAGDTVDTLGSMKDIALAVGGDIRLAGISASGAAEGMTELFKAGLDTTAIFGDLNAFMDEGAELGGALRASIDLAAASELELGEAASLSAVVLSTFGDAEASAAEQAEFVNFALNNMVKAADASVADVSDLAAALTNVGPTAAAAGLDLEEVNTALAILSTRGITGAEAGTALKSAIANMRRPTAQVQGELEKWGISLFDAEGNMFDMVEIIGQFELALGDATEEQKAQAIQTIAGTFGMNAMNALLGEGVEGWSDMQMAMADAATIQEQAAAKTATYSGIIEALDGTIETLKIQVGDALLPILSDLALSFTEIASNAAPFIVEAVQTVTDVLAQIISLTPGDFPWEDIFPENVADFAYELSAIFENIVTWLRDFIPIAIQTASNFWTNTLLPALQQVWSFITSTLVPVFQAIWSWLSQLLTTAIQFLVAEWEQILLPSLMKLAELWTSTILPALTELWTWLQTNIPLAIDELTSFWSEVLLPTLVEVWGWIQENLFPLFAELMAWLINQLPSALETLATFWKETLRPGIEAVATFVTETLLPIFSKVLDWLQVNLPVAIETASTFWEETLKPALEVIWLFIQENIIPIFQKVFDWLSINIPEAIETAKTFWEETLKPALETVWTFITEDLVPIFETVVEWLEVTIPAAIEVAKTFWEETLLPALETIWEFLEEDLIPLWESLKELFDVGMALAIEALTGLWEKTLQPALETLWNFIKEDFLPKLKEVKEFIAMFLEPAFKSFKENALDKWKTGIDKVKEAINTFKEKIDELKEKLKNLSLPDWLTPGSPPPLFFALQDVNKAMDELTSRQLPRMQIELSNIAPLGGAMISAPAQAMAGPTMAAQSVMQNTVNLNQTNNINSDISQSSFDARVQNSISRAFA